VHGSFHEPPRQGRQGDEEFHQQCAQPSGPGAGSARGRRCRRPDRMFVVGPMAEPDLRRAISGPADAAGLEIEPGLVDTILADLRSAHTPGGYEAGVLRWLSQAMLVTWNHREEGRLTSRGYGHSGGVRQATVPWPAAAGRVPSCTPTVPRRKARRSTPYWRSSPPSGWLSWTTAPPNTRRPSRIQFDPQSRRTMGRSPRMQADMPNPRHPHPRPAFQDQASKCGCARWYGALRWGRAGLPASLGRCRPPARCRWRRLARPIGRTPVRPVPSRG
jgi:hypothetical protein